MPRVPTTTRRTDRPGDPFSVKELDYLEQKCGIHYHHLYQFIHSVLWEMDIHPHLIRITELRRTFFPDEQL